MENKDNRNIITPIALIYSILWCIALFVGFLYCLNNSLSWLIYIASVVTSAIVFIVLWALSGAIDRINELEKKVAYLSNGQKIDKKSKNNNKDDLIVDAFAESEDEMVTVCPKCGNQIFEDEEKCSNCGYKK